MSRIDRVIRRNKRRREEIKMGIVVIAKCIGCGEKRKIRAGEIPQNEQPCCDKCGMPMIAEKAKVSNS